MSDTPRTDAAYKESSEWDFPGDIMRDKMMQLERELNATIIKWQPIETAPRNGLSIIIRSSGNRLAIARWEEMRFVGTGWMVFVPCNGGWGNGTDTFIYLKEDQPTHWMPLPKPPKE